MKIVLEFERCMNCPHSKIKYANRGWTAQIICEFEEEEKFICYMKDAFEQIVSPKMCPMLTKKMVYKMEEMEREHLAFLEVIDACREYGNASVLYQEIKKIMKRHKIIDFV